jgi:RNA polymerase sigma-70 factor (ECF subfamily)
VLAEAMIARAEKSRDALRRVKGLETKAAQLVSRGKTAWPRIAVDPAKWIAHVASRVDDAPDVAAALEAVHAEDLWLAYACGHGDSKAIAELDKQFKPVVEEALARLKGRVSIEDVAQLLREKLLVAKKGRPKILDYSGRGPLGGFIRIAAIRTALSATRHGDAAGMQAVTREELLGVPAAVDDPELTHLRGRYAKAFKSAFEAALSELTPEDRNLLRLSLVDGLSIDEIGSIFGYHRATAARRLGRCREQVQTRTRKMLLERLKLGTAELRSIINYIQSHLDLSIQRLLADEVPRTTSPAKSAKKATKKAKPTNAERGARSVRRKLSGGSGATSGRSSRPRSR